MKTIKCRIHTNSICLKCGKLEQELIIIGAFVMCRECWEKEFGIEIIDIESELYKTTYLKWLKKYQETDN